MQALGKRHGFLCKILVCGNSRKCAESFAVKWARNESSLQEGRGASVRASENHIFSATPAKALRHLPSIFHLPGQIFSRKSRNTNGSVLLLRPGGPEPGTDAHFNLHAMGAQSQCVHAEGGGHGAKTTARSLKTPRERGSMGQRQRQTGRLTDRWTGGGTDRRTP